LFVCASGERGGAEVALQTLVRHLDRRRFVARVCSLTDGPFVEDLRRDGLAVDLVPTGPFRDVASGRVAVRRLTALMRDGGCDVVQSSGTGAHLYAGRAAARAGLPSVFHVHDLLDWRVSRQGLLHVLARLVPATAAVAASSYSARVVGRAIRAGTVLTIPYGLDAADRAIAPAGATRDPGAATSDTPPLVLWCGRLQRWKGAHLFIEAAARVHRARPAARFSVVGGSLFGLETGYARELRDQAAALNVGDVVSFAGHVEDVATRLAQAEVVVHSSIRPEPFGLVILEAMLAGKPVVAPAAGGPLDLIEPEVTGLLVPPRDPEALARAITRLLDDADLRRRLGAAARSRATSTFSAATMARRFEALYDSLCPA